MPDQDKTREQLIEELQELRRRVAALQTVLQGNQSADKRLLSLPAYCHLATP
jgi:predicted component of type VI protein secretion system